MRIFLLIVIYLFSPWASVRDTCLSQGVKSCDLILVSGIYWGIVFAWRCRRYKTFCFVLSRLDVVVLFYSACLLLSAVWSWEYLDRDILLMNLACGLLYLAARNVTGRQVRLVFVVFPLLMVGQLWYGIAEQTGYFYPGRGVELVHGSFFNTGLWCCFVACVAVLSCGLVCRSRRWWLKGLYGASVVLSLGLLYAGNSRAAWLAFVAGAGYLLCRREERMRGEGRWLLGLVLAGVLLVAGLSTRHKGDSASGRVLIWKITGQMCKEQPFGRGLDGFRRDYMGFQQQYFEQGGSSRERMLADDNLFAFNDLLRVFVEQGIGGVLLLLVLVYFIFKEGASRDADRGVAWVLRGVLLVWLVFSLFSYPGSRLQTKGLFVIFLAMLSSLDGRIWSFTVKRVVLSGLACVSLFVMLEVCSFRRSVEAWNTCCRNMEVPPEYPRSLLSPLMNTPEILPNCALFLNRKGETRVAEEVAGRGVRLYHSYGCCVELGIALERQGKLREAEEAWQKAEHLVPNRFKPLYLQMEMWEKAGDTKRAVVLAERLLNKEVKVLSPELSYYLGRADNVIRMFKLKCL